MIWTVLRVFYQSLVWCVFCVELNIFFKYKSLKSLWQHCIKPCHQHSLSSCYWLDSGLSVVVRWFWRRRGFGEWFAGRMGSYAFNASLLLLASQKSPTLLFTKTTQPSRVPNPLFWQQMAMTVFYIIYRQYTSNYEAGANCLFALKLYCQDY